MKNIRPLLSIAIGLLLLVQGFAVAAAEQPSFQTNGAPVEQVVPAGIACDGHSQDAGANECCDTSCPNMATCALAHMAAATSAGLAHSPVRATLRAESVLSPASFTPQSLLRPPIALQS